MAYTKEQEKIIRLIKESRFFCENFTEIPGIPGSDVKPLFVYNFQLELNLDRKKPILIIDRGDNDKLYLVINAKGYLKRLKNSKVRELDAKWIEVLNKITEDLILKAKTYQKSDESKSQFTEELKTSPRLFSPSSTSSELSSSPSSQSDSSPSASIKK